MNETIIAEAKAWLKRSTTLEPSQRASLASLTPALLEALPSRTPAVIGIGGPPGTGKSTLARLLHAILGRRGTPSTVLSLDDYYLPKADRARLARTVHPLFAQRGAPGTHDLDLLVHDLDGLLSGRLSAVRLPRFDKATDDRLPDAATWTGPPPAVIFLEGWCIGCPPADSTRDAPPINDLERLADPDGQWRKRVWQYLAEYDRRLGRRLDVRWLMLPADWDCVVRWRWRQEQELGDRMRLETTEAVRSFLDSFERWGRHMMLDGAAHADLVIHLDAGHCARLGDRR